MSKNTKKLRKLLLMPPLSRHRLSIIGAGIALPLIFYTLAGFFLAPYLIRWYATQYAAKQFHAQLRLGQVRINPFLLTCEAEKINLQIDKKPFLFVQRFFVDLEPEGLFRGAWIFADLTIERPILHLVIGTDGRLNLVKFAGGKPPRQAGPVKADRGAVMRLLLKHMALSGGTVRLSDLSKARPVETTVRHIDLELSNISTLAGHRGTYALAASLPAGGALGWRGKMSLQPISATGTIAIKDFKPAAVWNQFRDRLNLAEPTGIAKLTASYNFSYHNGEPALLVNPLNFTLRGLSLMEKGAARPLLKLENLSVAGGRIDFAARRMVFPSVTLRGGYVTALVDKTGIGNWQRLGKATPRSPAPKRPAVKTKPDTGETPQWRVSIGSFSAAGLGLHYRDASLAVPVSLEANLNMSLAGGGIDLGGREASIKRLAITGGGATFTRAAAGAYKQAEGKKGRPEAGRQITREEGGSAPKRPWRLALNEFCVSGVHAGFINQGGKPPLAYDLTGLRAEVKNFDSAGGEPITFEAQAGVRQGGSAHLTGTISQPGGKIEAHVSIARLNLDPLRPLVAQQAALALVSGRLSADMHLVYAPEGARPSLRLEGEAGIERFLLNEAGTGERFLSWRELVASGLDFGLNPDHLAIKDIRLLEPETKIVIFKDKSLNLAKVRRRETGVAQESRKESAKQPFPVAINRIHFENGVADFADLSLVLPFATRIERLKGWAAGISTKPGGRTSIKFEGQVGRFGQARAEGSLATVNPKQFTDIRVTFRNIAMEPLSPYSATFAGRAITSGKLNLDLDYNIKNSELLSNNSVVLKDFTLGGRIKSPRAVDLPLDLAVALLKDSDGKIDIAVPVRGNIDHPEFSYGRIIRQALFSLLTKIVTSPFRLLASLVGRHSKNLETVFFEPGRADPAPPEQEKLEKIAEALGKRKQLKLIVHGGFDPSLDDTALKSMQLRRALAQRLGEKLGPGEEPGIIAYGNAWTQLALEKMAGDKLAAFQAGYEKTTGKKAHRVNPVLALLGRASEDYNFYKALFGYLVEEAPLPEAELQNLAGRRGAAIVQELTGRFGVNASRIIAGGVVQTEGHEKSIPAKLELSIN